MLGIQVRIYVAKHMQDRRKGESTIFLRRRKALQVADSYFFLRECGCQSPSSVVLPYRHKSAAALAAEGIGKLRLSVGVGQSPSPLPPSRAAATAVGAAPTARARPGG